MKTINYTVFWAEETGHYFGMAYCDAGKLPGGEIDAQLGMGAKYGPYETRAACIAAAVEELEMGEAELGEEL